MRLRQQFLASLGLSDLKPGKLSPTLALRQVFSTVNPAIVNAKRLKRVTFRDLLDEINDCGVDLWLRSCEPCNRLGMPFGRPLARTDPSPGIEASVALSLSGTLEIGVAPQQALSTVTESRANSELQQLIDVHAAFERKARILIGDLQVAITSSKQLRTIYQQALTSSNKKPRRQR